MLLFTLLSFRQGNALPFSGMFWRSLCGASRETCMWSWTVPGIAPAVAGEAGLPGSRNARRGHSKHLVACNFFPLLNLYDVVAELHRKHAHFARVFQEADGDLLAAYGALSTTYVHWRAAK